MAERGHLFATKEEDHILDHQAILIRSEEIESIIMIKMSADTIKEESILVLDQKIATERDVVTQMSDHLVDSTDKDNDKTQQTNIQSNKYFCLTKLHKLYNFKFNIIKICFQILLHNFITKLKGGLLIPSIIIYSLAIFNYSLTLHYMFCSVFTSTVISCCSFKNSRFYSNNR